MNAEGLRVPPMATRSGAALIAASIGAELTDALTTLAGLRSGAIENNPLAAPIVGDVALMLAVKVVVGLVAAVVVLSVDGRGLRWCGALVIVALPLLTAIHNLVI